MSNLLKRIFELTRAMACIFIFSGLGEGLRFLFDIPIAGNILGMALIFFALKAKLIKLEWVKPGSDVLLAYLVLFFVPYGVGIVMYFDILQQYWVPLLLVIVLSTIITLYITAIVQQKLEK